MKHLVLLILIALAFGVSCTKSNDKNSSLDSGAHDHKKAIWSCPMHPQIKKDNPGTCPICGMSLVQAESTEFEASKAINAQYPEGHAAFQLSLERQQLIGVKLGAIEKKTMFKIIEAAGRVAFDPELYTAQIEFLEAVRQKERVKDSPLDDVRQSTQKMVESAKLRLKVLGLSDGQISSLSLKSSAGSSLLIPKQGENIWIYAEVFEMDLDSIQPGLDVTISGGSLGSEVIQGIVASVDRVINPASRTAKVRISVPNAKAFLRPEAYVDVTIRSPLGEQLSVPFDAVLDSGKESWIFVAKDGQFEPRKINVKFRAGDDVAISSGAIDGEKIVTSANFLIDSESRLKGVLLSQGSEPTVGTTVEASEKADIKKTPECPKGQVWHPQMNHCMNKVGN